MNNECIGCIGCRTYIESHSTCVNQYSPDILQSGCPCSICLVKGVCLNECEEYLVYWKLKKGIEVDKKRM